MSKVTEIIGDLKNIENTTGDVQASDADLTAIAALTGTSGLLKKTAVDTWTLDTTAYTTNLGTVTSVSGDSIISVATGITTPALTHSVADGYLHVPATSTTNAGKVLTAGTSAGVFTWETPVGGSSTLDGLSDVTLTTPITGQVLSYTGTEWVNTSPVLSSGGSIDDLTDVDTSTVAPSSGDVLEWNGVNWVPGSASAVGGGTELPLSGYEQNFLLMGA